MYKDDYLIFESYRIHRIITECKEGDIIRILDTPWMKHSFPQQAGKKGKVLTVGEDNFLIKLENEDKPDWWYKNNFEIIEEKMLKEFIETEQSILIFPNGQTKKVMPDNGTDFTSEEIHKAIGGYFEMLNPLPPYDNNYYLLIDEEGKLKNLPSNPLATKIYGLDVICGIALLCLKSHIK